MRDHFDHADIEMHSVLTALQRHIGADKGITAAQLVAEITGDPTTDHYSERLLREIVVQLRLRGHHVCATPEHGYYMAETDEELNRTCEFLYDRAMTSLRQIAAMKNISLPDLRGQLRLPLQSVEKAA